MVFAIVRAVDLQKEQGKSQKTFSVRRLSGILFNNGLSSYTNVTLENLGYNTITGHRRFVTTTSQKIVFLHLCDTATK